MMCFKTIFCPVVSDVVDVNVVDERASVRCTCLFNMQILLPQSSMILIFLKL